MKSVSFSDYLDEEKTIFRYCVAFVLEGVRKCPAIRSWASDHLGNFRFLSKEFGENLRAIGIKALPAEKVILGAFDVPVVADDKKAFLRLSSSLEGVQDFDGGVQISIWLSADISGYLAFNRGEEERGRVELAIIDLFDRFAKGGLIVFSNIENRLREAQAGMK